MKMLVEIPYGEEKTAIDIPTKNLLQIIRPKKALPAENPKQKIINALNNPINSKPLHILAKNKGNAVIVADDNTRLTPTKIIVPLIIDELNKAGIPDDKIKVITALGTHRPMTKSEFQEKFGNQVLDRVEVLNHNYKDPENLIDLGLTSNKTPISINRIAFEADFKIGVGNIVPHHIAGWAGGSKIVQPGISGEETTAATHMLSVLQPKTLLGEVENIVRTEMDQISRRIGLNTIVNTVLNQDGKLVNAFYGDLISAHRTGIKEALKVYAVPIKAKADIVVAGSHPCDIEWWQAHKTLYSAQLAVKPGGTIIILTPCPEGIAKTHPTLTEFAYHPPEKIYQMAKDGDIEDKIAASLAIAWGQVRKTAEVILISPNITSDETIKIGFKPMDTLEEAIEKAIKKHGENAKINVLTHAPETLPIQQTLFHEAVELCRKK